MTPEGIALPMPTQPQWEPTRLIPLKGQRPCKTMLQRTCLPTPSHSRLLLEVWKRNFCVREHSPINILLSGMPCGTLQGHHQRLQTAPCSRAQTPKRPQTSCSRTSTQVPQRTKHLADRSLKTQLVTFDYAGVKPLTVFQRGLEWSCVRLY